MSIKVRSQKLNKDENVQRYAVRGGKKIESERREIEQRIQAWFL